MATRPPAGTPTGDSAPRTLTPATLLFVRHASVFALAVAMVLVRPAARPGLEVGYRGGIALALLAYELVVHLVASRPGRLPTYLAIVDPVALAAVGWANPALLLGVLGVLAITLILFEGSLIANIPVLLGTLAAFGVPAVAADRTDLLAPGLTALGCAGLAKALGQHVYRGALDRTRAKLQTVVGEAATIVWSTPKGDPGSLSVTESAERLLGHPAARWTEAGFFESITHPDDRGAFRRIVDAALGTGGYTETTVRLRGTDGRYRHFMARVTGTNPGGGRRGVLIDITKRIRAERAWRRFAEVTANSPTGTLFLELRRADDPASLAIRFGNPVATRFLNLSDASLRQGVPLEQVLDRGTADMLRRALFDVARTGNRLTAERWSFPEYPGAYFNLRADRLSDGMVGLTFEDVTASVQIERRLRHEAIHDALTGLPNRVQLEEELHLAVDEAARAQGSAALLLLDLTQFKEVNDALGHRFGDTVLQAVASRLRTDLPDVRCLARLGGDEFAVVSHLLCHHDEALDLARRILTSLERPFEVDGIPLQCTGNVGVAVCPHHGDEPDELLKAADIAMYSAKRNGQGFALYDAEQNTASVRKVTLLGELREAMRRGDLQLQYQPVVSLRTGKVAKLEALVRWEHRAHGLMLPSEFIELAESSGMIHPLTRWIVVEAGRGANALHDKGHPVVISANISMRNLLDPDLVTFFELLVRTDGFVPSRLELEITETEVMEDPVRAFEVLDQLRTLGMGAAVDDFGVGRSSLAYLKHLPVTSLKIDRSFVESMAAGSGDEAIVTSTINMAQSFGLEVTAEGVASADTLHRLVELGADYGQGYFIAEPTPLDQLPALIDRLNRTFPELVGAADRDGTPEPVIVLPEHWSSPNAEPDASPSISHAAPRPPSIPGASDRDSGATDPGENRPTRKGRGAGVPESSPPEADESPIDLRDPLHPKVN